MTCSGCRQLRAFIWLFLFVLLPASPAELRAGRAAVDITPSVGTPLAGSYRLRLSKGVHDALHAKALVLEKDGFKAAMVVCDLTTIARPQVEEARRLIEQATGIPAAQIMISATHTHSGPVADDGPPHRAWVGGDLDLTKKYIAELPKKIAESVRLANAELIDAKASSAVGHEDSLSINRRWLKKDGSVDWNRSTIPTPDESEIVRPLGPIDPDVSVVYFESLQAAPLVTYVNFAAHTNPVGGNEISADYPYTLSELLKIRGSNMLTMFTIGAAGNINPLHLKLAHPLTGHPRGARIGAILAADVLQTYDHLQPVSVTTIQTHSEIVKLPLAPVSPEDVKKARDAASRFGKPDQPPFLELVQASKALDVAAREGQPLAVEVQVIALGKDVAFVAIPGEFFVELGLAIKANSPYRQTVIVELANGSIGYIPNRKAYQEGEYEAVTTRCKEGSGEMLVEAATRLLIDSYRNNSSHH